MDGEPDLIAIGELSQRSGAPAGRVRVVADSQPLDVLLGAIGALGPASGC